MLQLATYARMWERMKGLPEGAVSRGAYVLVEKYDEFTEESTREWTEEELAAFEVQREERKRAIAAGETDSDGKPLKPFRRPSKPKERVVVERACTLSDVMDISAERFPASYIDGLYAQAVAGIDAGVYLPNPSSYCGSCVVRDMCGLYGNRTPAGVPMREGGHTAVA